MQKNKIACLTAAALLAVNVAGMAPAHTSAESLWGSHHSLFSDRKASQVGDILTILSAEELNQKLASLKEELFNLRFQLATGQLENPMRIKEVKKTIARIKTVQTEQAKA